MLLVTKRGSVMYANVVNTKQVDEYGPTLNIGPPFTEWQPVKSHCCHA